MGLLACWGSGDLAAIRRLAGVVDDDLVARNLAGAFAGRTLISFSASPDPNTGGTLFHFENSHALSLVLVPERN